VPAVPRADLDDARTQFLREERQIGPRQLLEVVGSVDAFEMHSVIRFNGVVLAHPPHFLYFVSQS